MPIMCHAGFHCNQSRYLLISLISTPLTRKFVKSAGEGIGRHESPHTPSLPEHKIWRDKHGDLRSDMSVRTPSM